MSVNLPALSPDEAGYLDATAPHRQRLARLFAALQEYQRVADAGQLDQVDGNELLALRYQFTNAQQAFNNAAPSGRFDHFVQSARLAAQNGHDASDYLLQAQHGAANQDRDADIARARPLIGSGMRYQQDADSQLDTIVPATVMP